MKTLPVITLLVAILGPVNAAIAEVETLQNDGFVSGANATFQAGFISGEIAAARFVPGIGCPCVLNSVTLLFGGSTDTREMGLLVWDDPGGNDPGSVLFTGDVTLAGSNVALSEIDLTIAPIIINGPFRVGLEFSHSGVPTVATDEDGTVDSTANFIYADLGAVFFWLPSTTFGVAGDFVIRATIDNLEPEPDSDGDGVGDNTDNCLFVANANQRDTDADGYGNFCDADLDGSCIVNFADLNQFKTAFLSNDPDADLDGSGIVNFADLELVKQQFLGPPGPSGITNACEN